MNIIEKLGIQPIPFFEADCLKSYTLVCLDEHVRDLEQQRNEMLEALIVLEKHVEDSGLELYDRSGVKAIEKADPQHRTWQEIKELLHD